MIDWVERIGEPLETKEYFEFGKGRGCVDQSFTHKQLVGKVMYEKEMYAACMALEKTYGEGRREGLRRALMFCGMHVHGRLENAVKNFYSRGSSCIGVNEGMGSLI